MLECWINEKGPLRNVFTHYSKIPLFQHSLIPFPYLRPLNLN